MIIPLRGREGEPLNAKLELTAQGLALHSRGRTDQNRDYRQAAEVICDALEAAKIPFQVYLDSRSVQLDPLETRRLAIPEEGDFDEKFRALVREMNKGSRSNGAWRRILFAAAGFPASDLAAAIQNQASAKTLPNVHSTFESEEGARRLTLHTQRERDPGLARAKRSAQINELGHLQCERCKLVPSQTLGEHGDAVIEVHHAETQIADMQDGHITQLADLRCLCANCHRIVHSEMRAGLKRAL